MHDQASRVAIVLAAGKGRRMHSAVPKVLHPVAGRPMLSWVLASARAAGCERLFVVVGHGMEEIRSRFESEGGAQGVVWVEQREQRGTGHAVACCASALGREPAHVLVLSGDAPLVRKETLERLLEEAAACSGAAAVATVDEPSSLGRVIQDRDGGLVRIVEAADASPEELKIRQVNAGHYALKSPLIFDLLERIQPRNAQGELYLTDAVVAMAEAGGVRCLELEDPSEAWGINDRRDLSRVDREHVRRNVERLQRAGVTVVDPMRVRIEAAVEIGVDSTVHPDVTIQGETRIGSGTTLHQGVWVRDCRLGDSVEVLPYSVLDGAKVADRCSVGPFARLRHGTDLGEGVRIGNFVEVKETTLGPGTKASHLAYLGDATIGAGTNIGAGVVTCNYDGKNKHRTEIGDGAFVGSDTMLVAPVKVGARTVTGAGSVITEDVPDDSLALGRARQRNLVGWQKRRQGS